MNPFAATRRCRRVPQRLRHAVQRGFSLVELLVAVAIGMGLTLAITIMLIRSETDRRGLTSFNDMSGNGAYIAYTLDRNLRSAGSSFVQGWRDTFGCTINAARDGAQILPAPAAFPAPFDTVGQVVRVAPVVVQAGAGAGESDVLIVATGASGLGESPQAVLTNSATATSVRLQATVGIRPGDLVMMVQEGNTCMLQQVAAGFAGGATQELDFGGAYYTDAVNGVTLNTLGTGSRAWAAPLGNVAGNQPSFQLIGIGDNSTLFSYDLLRLDGNNATTPLADGVVDLRARYGVDTNDDRVIDAWVDPAAAPWDADTLLDGSAASRTALSRIISLRIGLVTRSATPERDEVSPDELTLFADLPPALQAVHEIDADDRRMRYRTVDFTVPLRNVMLMDRP